MRRRHPVAILGRRIQRWMMTGIGELPTQAELDEYIEAMARRMGL